MIVPTPANIRIARNVAQTGPDFIRTAANIERPTEKIKCFQQI